MKRHALVVVLTATGLHFGAEALAVRLVCFFAFLCISYSFPSYLHGINDQMSILRAGFAAALGDSVGHARYPWLSAGAGSLPACLSWWAACLKVTSLTFGRGMDRLPYSIVTDRHGAYWARQLRLLLVAVASSASFWMP